MRSKINFDTLQYMDELKNSGMPQEQAEAITKATSHAFDQLMETKELATKQDINDLRIANRQDINDLKNEMKELEMRMQAWFVKSMITTIGILGTLQTLFHFIK
jgi:hypothetical protein